MILQKRGWVQTIGKETTWKQEQEGRVGASSRQNVSHSRVPVTTVVLFICWPFQKSSHKSQSLFTPPSQLFQHKSLHSGCFQVTTQQNHPKKNSKTWGPITFYHVFFYLEKSTPFCFPFHPRRLRSRHEFESNVNPSFAPSFALEAAHVEGDKLPFPSCQQTPPGGYPNDTEMIIRSKSGNLTSWGW